MSTSEPTWSKQRNDTCEKNSFPGTFLPPSCKIRRTHHKTLKQAAYGIQANISEYHMRRHKHH